MKLYAIADLHLPGGDDKPMDLFGEHWAGHFEKISDDWRSRVSAEDVVLIPGDISWAMQLEQAVPDLQAIGALPGRKVLLRGNHDYWWSSISRVREALPPGMAAVQNDALDLDSCVVCGTRGWNLPLPDAPLKPEDEKIYLRELSRLELSLQEAVRLAGSRPIVCMTHYPPLYRGLTDTAPAALLQRYGVRTVVYGHLHGQSIRSGFSGENQGIRYLLTSCDSLQFRLAEVPL